MTLTNSKGTKLGTMLDNGLPIKTADTNALSAYFASPLSRQSNHWDGIRKVTFILKAGAPGWGAG